ncbi:hypothetical protein BU17DRAFT_93055 [Hysterangium stoloniferum]|nr:hypothetical protein BU17DRAFT_93055 [Hysterangium stoloniferum]
MHCKAGHLALLPCSYSTANHHHHPPPPVTIIPAIIPTIPTATFTGIHPLPPSTTATLHPQASVQILGLDQAACWRAAWPALWQGAGLCAEYRRPDACTRHISWLDACSGAEQLASGRSASSQADRPDQDFRIFPTS